MSAMTTGQRKGGSRCVASDSNALVGEDVQRNGSGAHGVLAQGCDGLVEGRSRGPILMKEVSSEQQHVHLLVSVVMLQEGVRRCRPRAVGFP